MLAIIVSMMIACLIMVILVLVVFDCLVKRRSHSNKRSYRSFKRTFFSNSNMNQSTRFTEQGYNEEVEEDDYQSRDEKLN